MNFATSPSTRSLQPYVAKQNIQIHYQEHKRSVKQPQLLFLHDINFLFFLLTFQLVLIRMQRPTQKKQPIFLPYSPNDATIIFQMCILRSYTDIWCRFPAYVLSHHTSAWSPMSTAAPQQDPCSTDSSERLPLNTLLQKSI